jgi:hypothetical protein
LIYFFFTSFPLLFYHTTKKKGFATPKPSLFQKIHLFTIFGIFYLVFLFWKVFIVSLKSFFGYHKVSKRETRTTVILSWDNKKLQLNFKEYRKGFDEATVKDLKEKIKLLTDVPIALMKLQVSGGKSSYSLKKESWDLIFLSSISQYEG